MALKKFPSNDKLSRKVMSFSYHIEWKTFTEASCTNNILKKRLFVHATFKDLWVVSCKETRGILWTVWVFFAFLEARGQKKILLERGKLSFLYVDIWFDATSVNLLSKAAV